MGRGLHLSIHTAHTAPAVKGRVSRSGRRREAELERIAG